MNELLGCRPKERSPSLAPGPLVFTVWSFYDGGRRPSQWPAYNLGDDDGGSRPSQWPADALEHEFALGPVLSTLLRSIGLNLGANMTILLRIGVRIVQEILQGKRSARSVNQGENDTPV